MIRLSLGPGATNLTAYVENNPFTFTDPTGLNSGTVSGPSTREYIILTNAGAGQAAHAVGTIGRGLIGLLDKTVRAVSAFENVLAMSSGDNDKVNTDQNNCKSPSLRRWEKMQDLALAEARKRGHIVARATYYHRKLSRYGFMGRLVSLLVTLVFGLYGVVLALKNPDDRRVKAGKW